LDSPLGLGLINVLQRGDARAADVDRRTTIYLRGGAVSADASLSIRKAQPYEQLAFTSSRKWQGRPKHQLDQVMGPRLDEAKHHRSRRVGCPAWVIDSVAYAAAVGPCDQV
jgi:hypothetical protein